jgi:hypothetical protein
MVDHHPIEGSFYSYPCYYCDYKIDSQDDYEHHVINKHGLGHTCYPSKPDLEKIGLSAYGKSWEI